MTAAFRVLVRADRERAGLAGTLDVEGEALEQTARRELAEEIGMGARSWEHLVSFYNSPGLLAEENHLFLARDLYEESRDAEENERIEIVPLEIAEIAATIPRLRDAKTLIGLSDVIAETDGQVFRDEEFIAHLERVAAAEDDLPPDENE